MAGVSLGLSLSGFPHLFGAGTNIPAPAQPAPPPSQSSGTMQWTNGAGADIDMSWSNGSGAAVLMEW